MTARHVKQITTDKKFLVRCSDGKENFDQVSLEKLTATVNSSATKRYCDDPSRLLHVPNGFSAGFDERWADTKACIFCVE